MYKIVVLVSLVILVSCSPQKRLARLLDKYPLDTETVVQYRDTTIYRDTIIFVQIPGDTIIDSILIPVEVDVPYMELKRAVTYAEATAWIQNNRLGLRIIQYDTLFRFKLDSAIRMNIDTMFVQETITVPEYIKQNSFWKHGFLVLAGLILIGLILLFLLKR